MGLFDKITKIIGLPDQTPIWQYSLMMKYIELSRNSKKVARLQE